MILEHHDPILDDVQPGAMLTTEQLFAARLMHHDPRCCQIPPLILNGLYHWARFGLRPGGFLTAVLMNDLKDTVARADPDSARALASIVVYLVNELPAACHGSVEAMNRWADKKQREREKLAHPPPDVPAANQPPRDGGLAH